MSAIQMAPNASGTGTLSIASPNTNSNRTITLPDATTTLFGTADNASASDITGVNTTATVTSGTTAMTVGSATSLVAGMVVVAQGITPGTTISSIVGTAVTLSANANATLSAAPVTFYSVTKVVTPGSVGGQTCRAWVNFNPSSGTAVIRSSFNVSSVTVAGTGKYVINFTNAMPDANYSIVGTQNYSDDNADTALNLVAQIRRITTPLTTTTANVMCSYNQNLINPTIACFSVFR